MGVCCKYFKKRYSIGYRLRGRGRKVESTSVSLALREETSFRTQCQTTVSVRL